jgi:hypothetical protein
VRRTRFGAPRETGGGQTAGADAAGASASHRFTRELQRENGGLESYNKSELVELAASLGIEKRTTMSKGELVDAIAKAARSPR